MDFVIDRVEGALAVCEREDGVFFHLDLSSFPSPPVAGGAYRLEDGVPIFDPVATEKKKQRIRALIDSVFE